MLGGPPGGYGPRPGDPADPEKTPVALHAKPSARVPTAPGLAPPPPPRATGASGSTLARLGVRGSPSPEQAAPMFPPDEEPTASRANAQVAARLVRNWAACSVEDQRLIEALALRLRPGL